MSGWIDKAKDFIKGHPEQARDALEKAEDLVNERTGGKYAEQVDRGSDALGEQLGLPPEAVSEGTVTPEPEDAAAPEPGPGPEAPTDPGAETGLPHDRATVEIADTADTADTPGTPGTPGTADTADTPGTPGASDGPTPAP